MIMRRIFLQIYILLYKVYKNVYHARDLYVNSQIKCIIILVYRNLYHARDP